MADIRKAAGIILRDRQLLFVRARGKSIFMAPGGKPEGDETMPQALIRELREELNIQVGEADFSYVDTFERPAAGQPGKTLEMAIYMVNRWDGELEPSAEIEQMRWLSSKVPEDIEVGSIFGHTLLPMLLEQGLID